MLSIIGQIEDISSRRLYNEIILGRVKLRSAFCRGWVKKMQTNSTLYVLMSASSTNSTPVWCSKCWSRIFTIFWSKTNSVLCHSNTFGRFFNKCWQLCWNLRWVSKTNYAINFISVPVWFWWYFHWLFGYIIFSCVRNRYWYETRYFHWLFGYIIFKCVSIG